MTKKTMQADGYYQMAYLDTNQLKAIPAATFLWPHLDSLLSETVAILRCANDTFSQQTSKEYAMRINSLLAFIEDSSWWLQIQHARWRQSALSSLERWQHQEVLRPDAFKIYVAASFECFKSKIKPYNGWYNCIFSRLQWINVFHDCLA